MYPTFIHKIVNNRMEDIIDINASKNISLRTSIADRVATCDTQGQESYKINSKLMQQFVCPTSQEKYHSKTISHLFSYIKVSETLSWMYDIYYAVNVVGFLKLFSKKSLKRTSMSIYLIYSF